MDFPGAIFAPHLLPSFHIIHSFEFEHYYVEIQRLLLLHKSIAS
jgi:hypothetical protein